MSRRVVYYVYGPITEEVRADIAARNPGEETEAIEVPPGMVIKFDGPTGKVGLVSEDEVTDSP